MKNNHYIELYGKKVPLLTWTSTMDCWSFSLPAGKEGSCPLAVYGDNSICGSCYAQINRFNMPAVLNAQWIRFNWLKECFKTENGFKSATNKLIEVISESVKNNYFRVFDSGDFHSPLAVDFWWNVCRNDNVKHIKFWFPTRSYWAKNKNWILSLKKLSSLNNVSIRPSALHFNEPPPNVEWANEGTTVITSEYKVPKDCSVCPKSLNGGSCGTNNCRTCWDNPNTSVAYLVHGYMGRQSIPKISDKIKELRLSVSNKFQELTLNGGNL